MTNSNERRALNKQLSEEIKAVKELVEELKNSKDYPFISNSTHEKHHKWIETKLKREEAELEFWTDVGKRIATAGIWSFIGLVCIALVHLAKVYLNK